MAEKEKNQLCDEVLEKISGGIPGFGSGEAGLAGGESQPGRCWFCNTSTSNTKSGVYCCPDCPAP